MKNLINTRPSMQEIAENDRALNVFIGAMMGFDTLTIQSMLIPGRTYFQKYNMYQAIAVFRHRFKKVGTGYVTGNFYTGVSFNDYPGSVAIEFTWVNIPDGFFDVDEQALLEGPDAIKMGLVLVFEKGKIADIRWSKAIVLEEMIKKMMAEN